MNGSRGSWKPESAFRSWFRIPRTLLEVAFVPNVYGQLLEVPRVPVTEVSFQDHRGSLEYPTQLGLVGKPGKDVGHAFFEDMLGPGHHLASDAGPGR
jgi:hypothetical protein